MLHFPVPLLTLCISAFSTSHIRGILSIYCIARIWPELWPTPLPLQPMVPWLTCLDPGNPTGSGEMLERQTKVTQLWDQMGHVFWWRHTNNSVYSLYAKRRMRKLSLGSGGRGIPVEGQPQGNSHSGPVSCSWYFLHILILCVAVYRQHPHSDRGKGLVTHWPWGIGSLT